MAKVKAPLFGLEARGQLGGAIVYFPWKGIQCVRELVIPANPQTAAQQVQRGFMVDAVAAWHFTTWTVDDIISLRRWANIMAKVMTHINVFIKHYLQARIAADTWRSLSNIRVANVLAATADCIADSTADGGAVCHYGTTPTGLIHEQACVFAAGVNTAGLAGLTGTTLYYFQITMDDPGEDGRSGIFSFTTA